VNDLRRPLLVLAFVATATIIAACGGGSASESPADDGGSSAEPGASAEPAASTDSGGGGSGGGGSVPEDFADQLVPPASTVTLTQSAGETQTVIFHSTASFDELKSFYESAVDSLGGDTFKQEIDGSLTIGFGDEATGSGGLIVIVPSSEGGGHDVSVTTAIGS
jgi:hypothetical protein